MSVYATRAFWVSAGERAVKTVAQTGAALLTSGAIGVVDVDWGQVASVSGLAGVVSVLTSLASAQVGNSGPSLAAEELSTGRHAADN